MVVSVRSVISKRMGGEGDGRGEEGGGERGEGERSRRRLFTSLYRFVKWPFAS